MEKENGINRIRTCAVRTFSACRFSVLLAAASCTPFVPLVMRNPPPSPPFLVEWGMTAADRAVFRFSAPVLIEYGMDYDGTGGSPAYSSGHSSRLVSDDPANISEDGPAASVDTPGSAGWKISDPLAFEVLDGGEPEPKAEAILVLSDPLPGPGQRFEVSGTVIDAAGTRLSFSAVLYGYNGNLPGLRLNEIRMVNSSARAEAVEILAESEGNLGGVCLVTGNPGDPGAVLRMPPVEITAGEFIIVHFRADEDLIEGAFGGYGYPVPPDFPFVSEAINLYLPGGLSATSELIILMKTPMLTEPIDGLMYTNKSNDPDDRYRGFGTRAAYEKAQYFAQSGLWPEEDFDTVDPEDFPSSVGATVTRTLARFTGDAEIPGKSDWYLSATGTGSIGTENSDEVYTP